MLVRSKFEKDDIITIKTILGEEIVCKYIENVGAEYLIADPLAMGMAQQGAMLMSPVMTGDVSGVVSFKKEHIMWMVPVVEEVKAMYIEKTTGIVPVMQSSKIIT